MADPVRLLVLKKLTFLLQGITEIDGVTVNLTQSVFRGRSVFGENDALPMLSILESPRNTDGIRAGENRSENLNKWGLMLQGWVKDDKVNPTDPAYHLAEAVMNRLKLVTEIRPGNSGQPLNENVYLLGRSIVGFEVGQPIIRPPIDNLSSKAFFYLQVDVELA